MPDDVIAPAEARAPAVGIGAVVLVCLLALGSLLAVIFVAQASAQAQATASQTAADSGKDDEKGAASGDVHEPAPAETVIVDETTTTTTMPGDQTTVTERHTGTATTTIVPTPAASPTPSATPTPPPPLTTGSFGTSWDAFWKSSLQPLAGFVTFAASAAIAIFVLGRLLVEVAPVRLRRSSRKDRRVVGSAGVAALVGVPLAIGLVGVFTQRGELAPSIAVLATLGFEAIIGAVLLAFWLASLLRLDISVTGEGEKSDASTLTRADIFAQLKSISTPSRAIEVPTTAALATLSTSLSSLTKDGWVEALKSLVLFVVGVVPFKVDVIQQATGEASVSITRFDRLTRSKHVSLLEPPFRDLGFVTRALASSEKPENNDGADVGGTAAPQPEPALPTSRELLAIVIAAHVVAEIATVEVHDFTLALMGATRAESIALRSIAMSHAVSHSPGEEAIRALEAATKTDPYNALARWSLDYMCHRDASDDAAITAYAERLLSRLEQRREELGASAARDDAPYSSALITLSAMTRNHLALNPAQVDRKLAGKTVELLSDWGTGVTPTADNRARRARARIDLIALARARGETPDSSAFGADTAIAVHPDLAYSLACYFVRWERKPFDDDTVKALLQTSRRSAVARAFVQKDPEMHTAVDHDGFTRLLQEWGVEPHGDIRSVGNGGLDIGAP